MTDMKTKQEIFDTVVTKLLEQGKACYSLDFDCVYRDGKGNKCAVGHLIRDDMYDADIEGLTVGCLRREPATRSHHVSMFRRILIGSGIDVDDEETVKLVELLQFAHDAMNDDLHGDEFTKAFLQQCRGIARNHGLEWKYD